MTETVPEFTLPNLGAGPDPFSLATLDEDTAFAVLFFQRDYYCTNCREQVQELADRIEEFRDRRAEVISILPEPPDQVRDWQESYDLPYPLLADPEGAVGTAYDQPVRFGILGRFSDFLGRMPAVVIVDRREVEPQIVYVHKGRSTFDRPDIDTLLAELDDLNETVSGKE